METDIHSEKRTGLRRILSGRIIFVLVVLLAFTGIEILRERLSLVRDCGHRLSCPARSGY